MMSFNKLESSVLYECGISNRTNARSISWNSSGTTLAMACSDRMTRLYTMADLLSSSSSSNSNSNLSSSNSSSSVRELAVISGHTGIVDRVRFHSTQDSLLATTSGADSTVRLWDVRSSSAKSVGKIDLVGNTATGKSTIDISWSPSTKANLLAVTEKNGNVHVVDTRKLSSGDSSGSFKTPSFSKTGSTALNPKNSPFVKTFAMRPKIVDACIFSPSGDHLVAATSDEGYGELTIWNWEREGEEEQGKSSQEEKNDEPNNQNANNSNNNKYVYPAHTGPIYSMCFTRDGRKLATGGGDALVGLWDVNAMVCTSTITRSNRFIRSVSFSYDSQIVATSTEENRIDFANSQTGEFVGKVSMSDNSNNNGGGGRNNRGGGFGGGGSGGGDRNAPGADEIAFHPKAHIIACARCDSVVYSPLTIMKLTLGRQ